eukprot:COSAG02_NODE_762_length_17464_cov_12.006219_16_plen_168_part_00
MPQTAKRLQLSEPATRLLAAGQPRRRNEHCPPARHTAVKSFHPRRRLSLQPLETQVPHSDLNCTKPHHALPVLAQFTSAPTRMATSWHRVCPVPAGCRLAVPAVAQLTAVYGNTILWLRTTSTCIDIAIGGAHHGVRARAAHARPRACRDHLPIIHNFCTCTVFTGQ